MAGNKFTPLQREELHEILHWLSLPVKTPQEHLFKTAVKCFLNGKDAMQYIVSRGTPPFVAKRAVEKAVVFIGNERAKRRSMAAEILEQRSKTYYKARPRKFTTENFHVTINDQENRNYGMVNASIHCVVEVWVDDDDVEKEYLVNFSDYKTKEWLTRLLVWALMNKREVLIKPCTEEDMSTMKVFIPKDKVEV